MEKLREIVDKLTILDMEIEGKKKEKSALESELQIEALKAMENKKVKTIQYFGSFDNYALVTKSNKVDLLSYDRVKGVIGKDFIEAYITEDKEPKYVLKKDFKEIASGIFTGLIEFKTLDEVLKEIGLNSEQIKLATKKLKMDYVKDKKVLKSLGLKDNDIETWIFFIHEAMLGEKILRALEASGYKIGSEEFNKALEDIKSSVIVEETPKITVKYNESLVKVNG